MSTVDEIERRLLAAVTEANRRGVALIKEGFGVRRDYTNKRWIPNDKDTPCACVMGCLLLVEQPVTAEADHDFGGATEAASEALGVSVRWMCAFCEGFDGRDLSIFDNEEDADRRKAYSLGLRLTQALSPRAATR